MRIVSFSSGQLRWIIKVLLVVFLIVGFEDNGRTQGPWGTKLNLPLPPDGGPHIPEFVLFGQGSLQGLAGLATIINGMPAILYDPGWVQWFGGLGSPSFRFLRAHEYAHHRLGHALAHLTTPPMFLPALGYKSELDADCWAVRILDEIGDYDAVDAGFNVYKNVLPPQDMQGRPGAWNRIKNMEDCLSH